MGLEENQQRATDAYNKMRELGVDGGVEHKGGCIYTDDKLTVNVNKVENPEAVSNIARSFGAKVEYTTDD